VATNGLESLDKPDFQRETTSWDPSQIRDFIKTFIEGDFYPVILLWVPKNGPSVIDGAHRFSAIIAWVEDDYGDGPTSKPFFGGEIPSDQLKYANETLQLVEKEFGKYEAYHAALHPTGNGLHLDPVLHKRAIAFGQRAIATQLFQGMPKRQTPPSSKSIGLQH
jgi:hypothetical protein